MEKKSKDMNTNKFLDTMLYKRPKPKPQEVTNLIGLNQGFSNLNNDKYLIGFKAIEYDSIFKNFLWKYKLFDCKDYSYKLLIHLLIEKIHTNKPSKILVEYNKVTKSTSNNLTIEYYNLLHITKTLNVNDGINYYCANKLHYYINKFDKKIYDNKHFKQVKYRSLIECKKCNQFMVCKTKCKNIQYCALRSYIVKIPPSFEYLASLINNYENLIKNVRIQGKNDEKVKEVYELLKFNKDSAIQHDMNILLNHYNRIYNDVIIT